MKIRGYRIELGEIEARLLAYPGVREAVVLAQEDATRDKRLAAYIVSLDPQDAAPRVEELREFFRQKLPEYMVPAAYVRARDAAADRQRQARPEGAASAGTGTGELCGWLRGTANPGGGSSRRDLGQDS